LSYPNTPARPVKIAGIRKIEPGVARRAATATDLPLGARDADVQPVERAEFEGIDYGWVMQTTFVLTILVGAPVVAVLSAFVPLESWGARAAFAVRVGAPIWFLTAVAVALYARRTDAGDGGVDGAESENSDRESGTGERDGADALDADGGTAPADADDGTDPADIDRDAAAAKGSDAGDEPASRSE
jgi:hypothetical protein